MASWSDICLDPNNNVVAPSLASKKSVHFNLTIECREYERSSGSEEGKNKAADAKPNRFAWMRKFCPKGKKNQKNKDQKDKVALPYGELTVVHKSFPHHPGKSSTLPWSWKILKTKFAKREETVITPTWDEWRKDLSDKKFAEDFLFLCPEEEINALKIEFGLVKKRDDLEDNELQQEEKIVPFIQDGPEPTVQDLLDRHFLNNVLYASWYAEARKPLTMDIPLYGRGGILHKPITPVYIEPSQDLAITADTITENSSEVEKAKPNTTVTMFSRIRSFFTRFRKN